MASFLPLLLAGGAILALSGKKKSKGSGGIPLDKPVQVKKDGLVVNSGRSPVPPAVYESPLEPFEDVQQIQEALIAAGKPPKGGADGKWGGNSQGALDSYNHERGFKAEARDHLATPDSLRALHADAGQGAAEGVLANPQTGAGANLYCDISKLDCPPGYECVPIFGTPIPGFEDVGICIPIAMLNAGHMPAPEDYAPGGFNEVVFSPDFESVSIGGGWRFQTLEPWLYTRMKAGKLLTYALEGGLFWEDLISTSPKSFWNSTLASAGLAVPAGAAIGTKGWLSYRSAFRREKTLIKMVTKTDSRYVSPWKGPEHFVPGGYELISDTKWSHPGINWPPPPKVVEEYAGWVSRTPSPSEIQKMYGKPIHPDDIRIFIEPGVIHKGKSMPYGLIGEMHPGRPDTLSVERLKIKGQYPPAPKGQYLFQVRGHTYMGNNRIYASSMEEAAKMAKDGTPSRVSRMIELYGDDAVQVTDTWKEAVRTGTKIEWAKPALKQAAKGLGIPIIVAGVIGGTVYGADYLAKKLGDKQRDLIAESAVLAWKKFASTHYVRVGNGKKRIDKLPEVIAVQFFQAFVAQSILRFQKSTYE